MKVAWQAGEYKGRHWQMMDVEVKFPPMYLGE